MTSSVKSLFKKRTEPIKQRWPVDDIEKVLVIIVIIMIITPEEIWPEKSLPTAGIQLLECMCDLDGLTVTSEGGTR